MKSYKILSVNIQPGSKYNNYWTGNMQEVTTDHGVFIDNLPGVTYGGFLGHSWEDEVGSNILASIVQNSRQQWIKYEGEHDTEPPSLDTPDDEPEFDPTPEDESDPDLDDYEYQQNAYDSEYFDR